VLVDVGFGIDGRYRRVARCLVPFSASEMRGPSNQLQNMIPPKFPLPQKNIFSFRIPEPKYPNPFPDNMNPFFATAFQLDRVCLTAINLQNIVENGPFPFVPPGSRHLRLTVPMPEIAPPLTVRKPDMSTVGSEGAGKHACVGGRVRSCSSIEDPNACSGGGSEGLQ